MTKINKPEKSSQSFWVHRDGATIIAYSSPPRVEWTFQITEIGATSVDSFDLVLKPQEVIPQHSSADVVNSQCALPPVKALQQQAGHLFSRKRPHRKLKLYPLVL